MTHCPTDITPTPAPDALPCDSSPPRPLAVRRLDGWPVYDDGAADYVRDLDLAERAGLKAPRNIRAAIKRALADGLITIALGACDGQEGGALVRLEPTLTSIGSGAARTVDEFYLNREAALHVVMRLRTPIAVQLQTAIVRVFVLAEQGRLAPPPAPAALPPATPETRAELLFRIAGAMPQGPDRDAALAGAAALLSPPPQGLQLLRTPDPRPLPPGRWFRPSELAAELHATPYAVGRAITALGFRSPEQAHHRHRYMDRKANGDGVVECSVWDETVRDAVRARLSDPALVRRERRARVRAGAAEVLAALAALDEDEDERAPTSKRARRPKRPSTPAPESTPTAVPAT